MELLNNGITIRPFAPEDQPAARALILQGLGEHFGFIDETRNLDVDDIMAYYVTPGHLFLVAHDGPELVGTAALMFLGDGIAQMVRVSVSRQHRRRGIGRMLVDRLVGMASQRGIRRIEVETNNDWWDAIGLYQRYGFAQHSRDEESVYMGLNLSTKYTKNTK